MAAFFVRRLREGARQWPEDPRTLASPVDGVVGAFGVLERGAAFQAKGMHYEVEELLGDAADARSFQAGLFLTAYLAPRHYHRIHAPCESRLHTARAIHGKLLPVHPAVARLAPGLFVGNERLVVRLETENADLALVAVGAYNVGSISADFDSNWERGRAAGVTNRFGAPQSVTHRYDPPLHLRQGQSLMAFHMGSTVILLVSPKDGSGIALSEGLREGSELRLGTPVLSSEIQSPARRSTPH